MEKELYPNAARRSIISFIRCALESPEGRRPGASAGALDAIRAIEVLKGALFASSCSTVCGAQPKVTSYAEL